MMDTSMLTGVMFQWLQSGVFWLVAIFLLIGFIFGGLIIRKKRKLSIPAMELIDLGNGKMGIWTKGGWFGRSKLRAGWFRSKTMIFGLWDYAGEDECKLMDGRKVQCASSVDYHEINGTRGLVLKRKDDDPKILVPLTKLEISNLKIIGEIAPADMRDASVGIIKSAEKETMTKLEQYLPYIMIGGIVIFAFISIILIIQMVKHGQTEAKDLILEAGRMVGKGTSALPSTAP